jgi:hypothetical protein
MPQFGAMVGRCRRNHKRAAWDANASLQSANGSSREIASVLRERGATEMRSVAVRHEAVFDLEIDHFG